MIILRFSDYEADTISEHQTILSQHGHVWWAWWRKIHEEGRVDLLTRLKNATAEAPVEIALLDRVDHRCFIADCDAVEFDVEGQLPAPEPELVPTYYREKPFPAWVRLRNIRPVDEASWISKFGNIPSGDSTIYEARRPTPTLKSHLINADVPEGREGVLHISDLHFGTDHGHPAHNDATFYRQSLLERLVKSLPKLPACVVVSGDLTTRGEDHGLRSARIFLEKLAEELKLPRECVVIAPGNHDVLIDDEELTRDFSNEQPFRDLLNLFYGTTTPIERVHDIRDANGRHYVIGVLNSSRPRHKNTMDYGYVGRDRSAPLFDSVAKMRNLSRDAAWAAVVLHHHVLPAQLVEVPEKGNRRPVSLCLDAGELLSLAQANEVSAILHGHQHLPFSATVARRAEYSEAGAVVQNGSAVNVLASGSSGVAQRRIPPELGLNTYSFYDPFDPKGLRATCLAFGPARDPHELWSLVLA